MEPYLDPQRFPLTNRQGLTLRQQKLIDAVNLDDLREMMRHKEPLNEEQWRILEELEAKAALAKDSPTSTTPASSDSCGESEAQTRRRQLREIFLRNPGGGAGGSAAGNRHRRDSRGHRAWSEEYGRGSLPGPQAEFPLTTQPGLSLKDQRLIDAWWNLDDLREMMRHPGAAERPAAAGAGGAWRPEARLGR